MEKKGVGLLFVFYFLDQVKIFMHFIWLTK